MLGGYNLKAIMLGAGGHARSVLNVTKALDLQISYVVDQLKYENSRDKLWEGIPLLKSDKEITQFSPVEYELILGVGPSGRTNVRSQLYQQMANLGYSFPVLVAPNAVVATDAVIGQGTQILYNSYIGPGSVIGSNCVVNTSAIIEHDVVVLSNTHVAPGACVLGGCKIGENCLLGAQSCIIQNSVVPDGTFVKAGAIYKSERKF